MDTKYGISALKDDALFENIVNHRKIFNVIRSLDYSNHAKGKIVILPPDELIKEWESDYNAMKENMIYGYSITFDSLIKRISELQKRINNI